MALSVPKEKYYTSMMMTMVDNNGLYIDLHKNIDTQRLKQLKNKSIKKLIAICLLTITCILSIFKLIQMKRQLNENMIYTFMEMFQDYFYVMYAFAHKHNMSKTFFKSLQIAVPTSAAMVSNFLKDGKFGKLTYAVGFMSLLQAYYVDPSASMSRELSDVLMNTKSVGYFKFIDGALTLTGNSPMKLLVQQMQNTLQYAIATLFTIQVNTGYDMFTTGKDLLTISRAINKPNSLANRNMMRVLQLNMS